MHETGAQASAGGCLEVSPVGRIACCREDLKGDSSELTSHNAGPEPPPKALYIVWRLVKTDAPARRRTKLVLNQ